MLPDEDPALSDTSEEIVVPPPSSEKPKDEPVEEPADDAAPPEDKVEAKTEETEEEAPKPKSSGYARLKARHQALIAEMEALKAPKPEQEQPPKVEDFNGDYLAHERALVAFEARKAIRDELGKQRQADFQVREQQARQEAVQDFMERAEETKSKLPDFDKAIDTMYGSLGALPNVVRDILADAENGPVSLYHMAKNPSLAREIYAMGPIDAAREVGKLEAEMSMPKARRETKAPPVINAPKGGATPPRDIFALAKSDSMAAYVQARRAMDKKAE